MEDTGETAHLNITSIGVGIAADDESDSANYDYDVEEALKTYNLPELIPTTVVYGLTYMIGFVGNCLIIFVIARYQRMRSVSNLFLASLAAADLLLIITCIPVMVSCLG